MTKVLLIVYMLGGGHGSDYAYNLGFNFQEFATVSECELVIGEMKKMANAWHRGDKSNTIDNNWSAKCIPNLQTTMPTINVPAPTVITPPASSAPIPIAPATNHKRWDR